MTDVHSRGSRTPPDRKPIAALKAAPGAEADAAKTDVARHRLDKAGTQRKPDRPIGRRSKLSKQQQERRRRTGPEARSTKRKLRTSWQRALGPCGQNQNRQGEGNPEEHSLKQ